MSTAEDGRFYARVFGLAAAALLALLLLNILKPFFESILWAGLLAFLLAPVDAFLARKLGGRPALSALLLTVAGALFLGIVAVLPFFVKTATGFQTLTISSTAVLIVVGVALDTMRQLEAQLIMRNYRGFIGR